MIIMSKTYTPELTPEVLDRLEDYAGLFRDDFSYKKQAAWSGVYLQGLLHDGERKSIEPLSGRVTLPPGLDSKDPEQALQQFVNQSPWDDQALTKRYRKHLAETFASPEGIFVFDDISFPKQGKHSVFDLRGPGLVAGGRDAPPDDQPAISRRIPLLQLGQHALQIRDRPP